MAYGRVLMICVCFQPTNGMDKLYILWSFHLPMNTHGHSTIRSFQCLHPMICHFRFTHFQCFFLVVFDVSSSFFFCFVHRFQGNFTVLFRSFSYLNQVNRQQSIHCLFLCCSVVYNAFYWLKKVIENRLSACINWLFSDFYQFFFSLRFDVLWVVLWR